MLNEPKLMDVDKNPSNNTAATTEPVAVAEEPMPERVSQRKRKPTYNEYHIVPEKRESKTKKKKDKNDTEAAFETVWICSECKEAECMMRPEADVLIVCEGPCRRLFHYPCAGLSELPPDEEDYVCSDCMEKRHRCAVCQAYGDDGLDVFVCSRKNCGLFFHEACLAMNNVEFTITQDDSETNSDGTKSPEENIKACQFICAAHTCWTCTQEDLKEQEQDTALSSAPQVTKARKKSKSAGNFESKTERYVIRCIECPISYHVSCIPPTARFHELALLCHNDAHRFKLPDLDTESSLQNSIEMKADKRFGAFQVRRRTNKGKGHNLFFPGLSGDRLAKRENQLLEFAGKDAAQLVDWFCLPCDLKAEVHEMPPSYRHIQSLKYTPTNKPQRIPPSGETCQCIGVCADECINKMLYLECHGDTKKNTNCIVGPECGNRRIGRRQFKKCKLAREQGKGWGLTISERVLKGDVVIEYIGEVVDAKEKERRLTEWTKEHPNDHNFYMMELMPGWFIDARHEANLSRFINHSCDPNCVLLQINVGGYIRNGIFAKRDIAAGEYLSYDYHFDTRQGDRFVCRCGSKNCRGTMKDGINADSAGTKSRSELWEEAKAAFDRDNKFLAEYHEEAEKRRSQVDALVPASENPIETVASGVQARFRNEVIRGRIFLWRNAVLGSDFESRIARLERRHPVTPSPPK